MLIRFVVSNFMSFKEETEFNMLPSKGNGSRSLTHHLKKTNSGIEILKTAAIYGANAAGKSNLVKAIEYIIEIFSENISSIMPQKLRFRIDKSFINKPTTFRFEFEYKGLHYDYGIEVFRGEIKEEYLFLIKNISRNEEEMLFKRNGLNVEFGNILKKEKDIAFVEKYLKKELLPHLSVLSKTFGVFDENKLLDIACQFFLNIHVIYPQSYNPNFNKSLLLGNKSVEFTKKLLIESKTGIEDVVLKRKKIDDFLGFDDSDLKNELIEKLENEIEKIKKGGKKPSLIFNHKDESFGLIKDNNEYFVLIINTIHNSNFTFDFEEESDGTNRLYQLSPALEDLMKENDVVYIVDELERSMHPILAKEILKMYSTNSKTNSQLIFTTHESHLLDDELLRRDEIWFTEKKTDGSTEFYPLSNFNPRGDKVLERGYLQGRYGGIPFLGDFSKLVSEEI